MDRQQVMGEFSRLRQEHTYDRDSANNYGCFNVEACNNCNYTFNSRSCIGCHACDSCFECVQCVNCKHCAFCVGLNGAEYHFLNQQLPPAEYQRRMAELGIETEVQGF